MFVLEKEKRAENKATLHITGRDVEDMQINLEFDRDIKIWKFVSFASGEVKPPEKLINAVVSYLSVNKTFSGTASELSDGLKTVDETLLLTPNALSRALKENALLLEKRHNVKQEFRRSNGVRLISLTISADDCL